MTTSAERTATLVRALEASVAGDRSVIADLYVDDVDRDGAFSEIELAVSPVDVSGDRACVEWVVTVTHSGPLAIDDETVIEPTGTRVKLHGVTVAEFLDDRIASFRQYWDEVELLAQLRVHPAE